MTTNDEMTIDEVYKYLRKIRPIYEKAERKEKNITYKILKSINTKWIIVSFPTKNVKGKPMRTPNRPWFERMCNNLGYKQQNFVIGGEIFYVVKK